MKVLINSEEFELIDINKFGGEADIYTVNYEDDIKCVKVYYPEKRTSFNERKIISMINKFKKISLNGIENSFSVPEIPVYDLKNKKFCGFLMKYFNNHIQIGDIKFSNNTQDYGDFSLSDEKVFYIFEKLFYYLKALHKIGIILGDINPDNILLDKESFEPCIVDFDSIQFSTFYSNTNRMEYIDPLIKTDGYGNNKHFIYSTDSDIYTLAIIFYEIIIGTKPHFYTTIEPTDTLYKKNIDLSFIDFFSKNQEKLNKFKYKLRQNVSNDVFNERLQYIQNFYPNVFNYLVSIFSRGQRTYFYYDVKRPIKISNKNGNLALEEIDIISQPKEDPEELNMLLNQFELKI